MKMAYGGEYRGDDLEPSTDVLVKSPVVVGFLYQDYR